MIIEDPRRGITELDRVKSLASLCGQQRRRTDVPVIDGNEVVQRIVGELERSGSHMPESTKFVLRSAAAAVLLLMEASK